MDIQLAEIAALFMTLLCYAMLFYLGKKKQVDFGILILLGTAFGIAIGLIFKEHYTYTSIFGNIYTNVISAFVAPLLLFSIISSITNLGASLHLKKIGFKAVFFLLLNTLIASIMTLVVAIVLQVGKGFAYETITDYNAVEVPSFIDTITSLFPENLITQWGEGAVVPIVIFAIIIAIAYNQFKNKDEVKSFKAFIDAGNKVLGQAISWIITFTPYAVLSLIARAVGRTNIADLLPLLEILVIAYVLCAVQLFGVESLLIRFVGKLNPLIFLKKIAPAAIVAFTSQSSVGTIPVTVRQLEKELGVHGDIASFTSSLGANLGMPGCAGIWPVLLAIFSIHVLGLEYTFTQYAFLIILSVMVSIGTIGVPGTATIAATALFAAAGLPIELIVLLAPISSIVDMARTATNVVGSATASVLVAKTEGQLDLALYQQPIQNENTSKK